MLETTKGSRLANRTAWVFGSISAGKQIQRLGATGGAVPNFFRNAALAPSSQVRSRARPVAGPRRYSVRARTPMNLNLPRSIGKLTWCELAILLLLAMPPPVVPLPQKQATVRG